MRVGQPSSGRPVSQRKDVEDISTSFDPQWHDRMEGNIISHENNRPSVMKAGKNVEATIDRTLLGGSNSEKNARWVVKKIV